MTSVDSESESRSPVHTLYSMRAAADDVDGTPSKARTLPTAALLDDSSSAGSSASSPYLGLRIAVLVALLLFFLPWDFFSSLHGKSTDHLHDRAVLGGLTSKIEVSGDALRGAVGGAPRDGGGGGGGAAAALSTDASLPSGGGGGAELEWLAECRAALSAGKSGIGPKAEEIARLPPSFEGIRDIMNKADYTRNAVAAAWASYVVSVPALFTLRPHFTLLETSPDLELLTWDKYASLPHIDKCVYDGTDECDIHSLAVRRPLTEAQRGDPSATTGHPKLTRAPYDLQMYSQTLEHLYDLPLVAERMYNLAAEGGMVWISVPFWNVPHMRPSHQQGCSPCGLYGLLRGAGFQVLKLGWYGHSNFSDYLARPGSHWPNVKELGLPDVFASIPNPTPDAANTVWILAQKPPPGAPPAAATTAGGRVPLSIPTRPKLGFSDMFACLDPDDGQLKNGRPHPSTLLHLLNRFPAWLDADLANLVLAAVFQERLAPYAAGSPISIGGRTAGAIAGNLLTRELVEPWGPAQLGALLSAHRAAQGQGQGQRQYSQQAQRAKTLPLAGFISDLFEGFRDPLDALRAFALTVEPGAPLLLSCRTADGAFASRDTLGTCTSDGFLQLLCRAGLIPHTHTFGGWGRIRYTRHALTAGRHVSFRTYLPVVAHEGLASGPDKEVDALGGDLAGGVGSLGDIVDRRGRSAEKAIEDLAADIIEDAAGEAAFRWSAVVYAVVEGWTLPLVPHYNQSQDVWFKEFPAD